MALLGTGHANAVLGARRCCSDGSCVLARVADVPSGQMTIMETRPKQGCVTELYWGCQMLPGQPGHLCDSSGHKERSLAKVLGWRTGSSGGSSHPYQFWPVLVAPLLGIHASFRIGRPPQKCASQN